MTTGKPDDILPRLENCGRYLAQDNKGQWHYINHAGTWQGCPPPFLSVEEEREACAAYHDDLAARHDETREGLRGPNRANHGLMARVHRNAAAAIRKRGEG